ncbi:spermine oxidase-like [Bacillus rossius redtenbacheri]|uniref:spermine oxidase-like n=1 Tax=Bacillus rossius redtenbacheri TaxID=93214 RepID=UPI002FDD0B52
MGVTTQVVIVGAGAAGMAAASRLAERGITDFLILEAEDRIGGRIHSTVFGGHTVDKGGQWVHGERGNVVFEMAAPLGLLRDCSVPLASGGIVADGSGRRVDPDEARLFLGILQAIDSEQEQAMRMFPGSILDFYLQEYKRRLRAEGVDYESSRLAEPFFQLFCRLQESVDGCDSWTQQSSRGSREYWTCEGNLMLGWKSGGYHSVIDLLTKRFPDASAELPVRSKVCLNKEVTSVQWEGQHQVVTSCADGSVYLSDHVLVTVSLGVLKDKCQTLFQPRLPAYKLTAIQGLGIGTVDKIFLLFPHEWWTNEEKVFSIVWTREAIQAFRLEQDDGRRWLQDVFCFHPVDGAPSTLMAWVVGRSARHMESLPLPAVLHGCTELLQFFFGQLYDIPPALQVDRSTWGTNKHFRGSYSYRGVDSVATGATPALLAHPLVDSQGKPAVLFAGEATHEHYFSTVHGAVETGFREAERLAALCGAPGSSSE